MLSLRGVSLDMSLPLWCGSPGLRSSPSLQALLSSSLLIYSPTSISILSPFKKFPSVLGESLLEPGCVPGIGWIWINVGLYSVLKLYVGEESGEELAPIGHDWSDLAAVAEAALTKMNMVLAFLLQSIFPPMRCEDILDPSWDGLVIIFLEHKHCLSP